jgi:hypothetical protein
MRIGSGRGRETVCDGIKRCEGNMEHGTWNRRCESRWIGRKRGRARGLGRKEHDVKGPEMAFLGGGARESVMGLKKKETILSARLCRYAVGDGDHHNGEMSQNH